MQKNLVLALPWRRCNRPDCHTLQPSPDCILWYNETACSIYTSLYKERLLIDNKRIPWAVRIQPMSLYIKRAVVHKGHYRFFRFKTQKPDIAFKAIKNLE